MSADNTSPAPTPEDRVEAAIDARRRHLRLSAREAARLAHVTPQTYRNVAKSATSPRPATEHRLEYALGWAPDSIQAVREGRDPTVIRDTPAAWDDRTSPDNTAAPTSTPDTGGTPTEPGFRASPRDDGSGIIDYWMTDEVAGEQATVHFPDSQGRPVEEVRAALHQSIQHLRVTWGLLSPGR
jgi:hypothetical protein